MLFISILATAPVYMKRSKTQMPTKTEGYRAERHTERDLRFECLFFLNYQNSMNNIVKW